jgi:membrane-associated protein
VVLARFVPILRALVPMLAGISEMDPRKFIRVNILGATLWVGIFMVAGYLLGNVELVKENLEITVLIIVVGTSLFLPLELLRDYLAKRFKRSTTASVDDPV